MGYPTNIVPQGSLPADNTTPAGTVITNTDLDVYLNVASGTGTAQLIQMGPGGVWVPYGPSWTVTPNAGAARLVLPKNIHWAYHVMFTGATATTCSIVPVVR